MSQDELAVMDGGKCILQVQGVRPFFSEKFDITKYPQYKYLSDSDPKNAFDIKKYLSRSFAAADRDAVEHLIAKLRAEISKAVADSYGAPKKPGRSRPELNYRKFEKMFPEFFSGEYRSLHMEAGPGLMPLHLQWIDTDVIAVSHTFEQNGDLMYDPEMTFRVDREKGTLESLTFQQDGFPQLYQEVYPEPGKWRPKLRNSLNSFAQQWFKNISQQRYHKHEAVVVRNGEDVTLAFDPDGNAIEPAPPVQPEAALPEAAPSPARDPLAPAYEVGDTVYIRDRAFVIEKVEESRVLLKEPNHDLPIYESMAKMFLRRRLCKIGAISTLRIFSPPTCRTQTTICGMPW